MDGQRFDDLAKTLAGGQSRRRVMKLLGAGALGLFGVKRAVDDAAATMCLPRFYSCDFDIQCCSGTCRDVGAGAHQCAGQPLGATCSVSMDCDGAGIESGTVSCVEGICTDTSAICAAENEGCFADSDCCDGLVCEGTGLCVPVGEACAELGEACEVGDCCGGLTCSESGVCIDPETCGFDDDTCEVDSDCCSGTCLNGACAAVGTCLGYYDLCESDDQCCSGFCQNNPSHDYYGQCYGAEQGGTCAATSDCVNYEYGDICESGLCCRGNDGFCNGDAECCSGSCVNGACQAVAAPTPTPGSGSPTPKPVETVTPSPTKAAGDPGDVTTLPATGAGPSSSSGEAIVAAGVIGAAALLAAGTRLRRAAEPEN